MSEQQQHEPTEGVPVGRVLFWLFWVIQVVGFVVAFGCGTVFGLGGVGTGGASAFVGAVGMVGAAVLFYFCMRQMKGIAQADGQKLMSILGLLLIANFVLFGSCVAIF